MQPESTPGSGAYDFLNQQPATRGSKFPMPKLPRLAWIIIVGSLVTLLLLVTVALLFGGGSRTNTNPYVESLSYAQEITRVSNSVKQMSQDPNTQSIAATTSATLLSDYARINKYLADTGIKVEAKNLPSKEDKDIDSQLQEAAQSNQLPKAYSRYLNSYLTDYQSALQVAYNQAGPEGKNIIKETLDSVKVLLGTPIIKGA